jgi:hypothetical protein
MPVKPASSHAALSCSATLNESESIHITKWPRVIARAILGRERAERLNSAGLSPIKSAGKLMLDETGCDKRLKALSRGRGCCSVS